MTKFWFMIHCDLRRCRFRKLLAINAGFRVGQGCHDAGLSDTSAFISCDAPHTVYYVCSMYPEANHAITL